MGNDLAPNQIIREKHLRGVRAVHEARLTKIKQGNGVISCHLEAKFLGTRTGAKTFELRRLEDKRIALDNKLLVDRMRRIITHSQPVWSNQTSSAITIDHQSVLRPKSKSKSKSKKKRPKKAKQQQHQPQQPEIDLDLGLSCTMTTNEMNEYEAHDNLGSLDYSADFGEDR